MYTSSFLQIQLLYHSRSDLLLVDVVPQVSFPIS